MEPILSAREITKNFGKLVALSSVSLDVYPGEIHAVLGENGAGKSTLMSILAGILEPSNGQITLATEVVQAGDPRQMKRLGLQMVYQHFKLVPNFTVAENLAIAGFSDLSSIRDLNSETRSAAQLAAELGWEIDFGARVKDLSVGVLQRIEILKAISQNARILILDEPTAVLSPSEVLDLLSVLQTLKAKGMAIVLIAHKLSEIMQCADRVTVLRRGQLVGTSLISDTSRDEIETQMIGERVAETKQARSEIGEKLLDVSGISVKGDLGNLAISDVSFSISSGEILGIGGVDGNGQVELAEAVARVRPLSGGTINWVGLEPAVVGYIPQDRQRDALALDMSLAENMTISALNSDQFSTGPFLKLKELKNWSESLINSFEIKASSPEVTARSLSGGNQQKVVVGRVLAKEPNVLIAVNPTRGLDFRSTNYVHTKIEEAASQGAAVLLISTDTDELEKLADRIVYLSRGQLANQLLGDAS